MFGRNLTKKTSRSTWVVTKHHFILGWWVLPTNSFEKLMLMAEDLNYSNKKVQETLRRHTDAFILQRNYFFDYGNAFLLEASRAGAAIMADVILDTPSMFRHHGTHVF
jgi:urocanate hydratase